MLAALVAFATVLGSEAFNIKMPSRLHKHHSCYMSSAASPSSRNILQDPITLQTYREIEESASAYTVPLEDELLAMQKTDISRADNFFEATRAKTLKQRLQSYESRDPENRIRVDENFFELMNIGFDRRFVSEFDDADDKRSRADRIMSSIARTAAIRTSSAFELEKSKEEQLKDLKVARMKQRSGAMKLVPEFLHKYVDYLRSLHKEPDRKEIIKTVAISAFFSFVVWVNSNARSSFMYFVIGKLATVSALLGRGMPQVKEQPGGGRKKVGSWSGNAFKSALAITLLYSLSSFGAVRLIISRLLPITPDGRFKLAMVSSLLTSAYFTSFYEVFEKKGENGKRWKKAMEGVLSADEQAKLSSQVFSETELSEKYNYNYDPQIDDYPPKPKYIDEVKGRAREEEIGGGSGELDEGEASTHFAKWMVERRDARKAPIEDAAPEEPWVGGKEGMYVENAPKWLKTAYREKVLKANAWRDKPTKYEKDTSEFEPVEGPIGFRDKKPEWLDLFGDGVWEDRVNVGRRAARAFGTYRKTMWKIDKEVVLQKCDE